MAAAGLWLLFSTRDRDEVFALLLLLTSVGMIWGTELFFVGDSRMNTVFKFYMVSWTFLSICAPYLLFRVAGAMKKVFRPVKYGGYMAAGAGLAFLLAAGALHYADAHTGGNYMAALFIVAVIVMPAMLYAFRDRVGKYAFIGAFIFLIVPAALYPLFSTGIKMSMCSSNPGFNGPHIDGLKYMETAAPRQFAAKDFDKYDYMAIDWINRNFREITPILEAPGTDMYSGLSRISIFTGMPTLVGWGYQVGQQSGRGSKVAENTQTASAIYSAADLNNSRALMEKAGIRYFYIGTIERNIFPNCVKLAGIGDPVFQCPGSALYKLK